MCLLLSQILCKWFPSKHIYSTHWVWEKWLPFCRQQFQINFLVEKLYFDTNFTEIYLHLLNGNKPVFGQIKGWCQTGNKILPKEDVSHDLDIQTTLPFCLVLHLPSKYMEITFNKSMLLFHNVAIKLAGFYDSPCHKVAGPKKYATILYMECAFLAMPQYSEICIRSFSQCLECYDFFLHCDQNRYWLLEKNSQNGVVNQMKSHSIDSHDESYFGFKYYWIKYVYVYFKPIRWQHLCQLNYDHQLIGDIYIWKICLCLIVFE